MITFKEFLAEKAMHRGSYADTVQRIGSGVKMGFEFEIFVPASSPVYSKAGADDVQTLALSSIKSISELEKYFKGSVGDKNPFDRIMKDYHDWSTNMEDEYEEANWKDWQDDDVAQSYSEKIAEREARAEARKHFDRRTISKLNWLNAEGGVFQIVMSYDLLPKYGFALEDGDDSLVYITGDHESEYQGNWEATAENLRGELQAIVSEPVKINGLARNAWVLMHDTSIQDDKGMPYDARSADAGAGIEIISPPLDLQEATEALGKIFSLITKIGASTNESTGLHVNVSIPDMKAKLDPLKLVLFMGDHHTLKQFDRMANTFTKSQLTSAIDGIELDGEPPKTIHGLMSAAKEALSATGKYYSVNLERLFTSGYLEFRAIGGPNYHKKLDIILSTIQRWIVTIELACNPEMQKKEYAKKVYKLLGMTHSQRENEPDPLKARMNKLKNKSTKAPV